MKSNSLQVSKRTISKSQLWKLDGNVLKNLDEKWMSDEEWNFKAKDDLIYIENISHTKVLGATSEGEVILEDFEEDKAEQLWKKGEPKDFASEVFREPDAEGYFTLENSKEPKFMTAISESCLEIRGNITLRRIPITAITYILN